MRAYIEINLQNLEKNYLDIQKSTNKKIIAVVKDNAYGHGLIECVKILVKNKVFMLAVATIEEAITIRKNLIFTPILLLGYSDNFRLLSSYKISIITISLDHLKKLSQSPFPIMIHLFIDIGMKREGIEIDEINEALDIIQKSKLILKGICTHYTSAESFNNESSLFLEVLNQIPNYENLLIHTSATSTYKENTFDTAIRVGLGLYGLDDIHLPVLSLKAPIIRKIKVNKDTSIGYERKELTPADGYVYTIGLGYGDGINRNYKIKAYVNERELIQIGNTCMDYLMLFSQDNYDESTIFTLINNNHSIKDIANSQNTIPYEIVVHLHPRIKRRVIK